jgi:hypothetical protein
MRRFHLVEFEDYPWFPAAVRDGITDYLRFFLKTFDIYHPVVPLIKEVLDKCGTNQIIEIAAGGGGEIEKIISHLDEISDGKTKVLLTDFYPNLHAFKLLKERNNGRFSYVSEPVDASDVPPGLKGFRTLFSAFHHFDAKTAKAVLYDAVKKNSPIGVFDGAERKLKYIFGVIFSTLLFIFLNPLFTRPVKLSRFFYTYIIPLIPLFALFDGVVSMLRMYTPEELLSMAKEADPGKFVWKSGKLKYMFGTYVTYLIGYPKEL